MLPSRRGPVPVAAYACLASSMLLVGSYVGLSKLLVSVFPIFLLAWLRFGIAAVAMAHWVRRGRDEPPLSTSDRWLLFWESFLGNFLFSICMLFGVSMTSALAAGVIMAAIPAAVAILSWLFLGERIARQVAAGIACAVAGIALLAAVKPVSGSAHSDGLQLALGYALLVAAVFCEASYVVIGKRLSGRLSPRRISSLINLWGLALVAPLGIWQAWSFDFASVAPETWGLLVFYALAASMWAVWLWMKGLQKVPAPQAGVFTVMLPVGAAATGVLFLGERLQAPQVGALALALLGVVLATWSTDASRPGAA
jgi:drug/metabolite transporter (DMT)-like permease